MNKHSRVSAIPYLVIFGTIFATCIVNAQQTSGAQRDEQQTRQAQAVSQRVYDKLQQAQSMIDSDEFTAALAAVTDVIRRDDLTEYEKSKVLQYIAYIQYSVGNMDAAIEANEELLRIPSLEPQTRKQTLYVLAQLNTANEQYSDAINRLEEWFVLESNPAPQPYILHAQVLYQMNRFSDMIEPIETALEVASARGMAAKEDWYALLNFAYFQEENYRQVRDIHKTLLANWPKKDYWTSLAGAYMELGDIENLIAAYDAAHTQGLLDTEVELVTMAQLYLQHDVPYKAGQLLEMEIANGRISRDADNYRLLSQAWMLAQEVEKAIPALRHAATLSDDGELDLRLGNAFLNQGRYEECVSAVNQSLRKGDIGNPGNAQISLGMCHYYLQHYERAANAFRVARETRSLATQARQWLGVIDREIRRDEQIEAAESAAQHQISRLENRREVSGRH